MQPVQKLKNCLEKSETQGLLFTVFHVWQCLPWSLNVCWRKREFSNAFFDLWYHWPSLSTLSISTQGDAFSWKARNWLFWFLNYLPWILWKRKKKKKKVRWQKICSDWGEGGEKNVKTAGKNVKWLSEGLVTMKTEELEKVQNWIYRVCIDTNQKDCCCKRRRKTQVIMQC